MFDWSRIDRPLDKPRKTPKGLEDLTLEQLLKHRQKVEDELAKRLQAHGLRPVKPKLVLEACDPTESQSRFWDDIQSALVGLGMPLPRAKQILRDMRKQNRNWTEQEAILEAIKRFKQ